MAFRGHDCVISRQPPDFINNLADGADVRESVQRDGNAEVILELADELQDLQRIEAEVRKQLMLERRVNRTAAQTLENLKSVTFEPVGNRRVLCARHGSPA